MVVAQGLALATTEAAVYLYQSAHSLWQAWQSSTHLDLSTSLPSPTTPTQADSTLTLTKPLLADPSISLHQQRLKLDSPQPYRTGKQLLAIPAWLEASCPQHGRIVMPDRLCRISQRLAATARVMSHGLDPREGITLLLPLAVLVVGGLAAAWRRGGMPLPKSWFLRLPVIVSVAGVSHTSPNSGLRCRCVLGVLQISSWCQAGLIPL